MNQQANDHITSWPKQHLAQVSLDYIRMASLHQRKRCSGFPLSVQFMVVRGYNFSGGRLLFLAGM